jgi:hypothetical protein
MSNVGLPARGHGCQYRYITMKKVTDVGLFTLTDGCPLYINRWMSTATKYQTLLQQICNGYRNISSGTCSQLSCKI